MADANVVYFETSWSILSTIGVFLTFAGISVVLITHACRLNFVPIVVSAACAVANGLCFYAYYTTSDRGPEMATAVLADIFWMIQEVGLSFYNYHILTHILRDRARITFLAVFWSLIVAILGIRIGIIVLRVLQISANNLSKQVRISRLHIGYFTSIALLETWSALFLITELAKAYMRSPRTSSSAHQAIGYLLRSAEMRLASLCCIGISRAVTYSSQDTMQKATTVAGQVDRFVYTLECLFPVVMLLDILGSKRYRDSNANIDSYRFDLEDPEPSTPRWADSSAAKCRVTDRNQHMEGGEVSSSVEQN